MSDEDVERRRLSEIAADSWYARGMNTRTIEYSAVVFARHWRGGACLELGPAEGVMTELLKRDFDQVTVVDGSEEFCRSLAERHPDVRVHCDLFENFETDDRFDAIVLGHVLEHVVDPCGILERTRRWLKPDGALYAAVPNARSVHRQAAVLMGLLETEFSLNEADLHHGHRRVYDPERFRADVARAGFQIEVFGGYWLKPLSNDQLEQLSTPEMSDAFMRLGERYPDIAAELYVIARPSS